MKDAVRRQANTMEKELLKKMSQSESTDNNRHSVCMSHNVTFQITLIKNRMFQLKIIQVKMENGQQHIKTMT